MLGFSDAGDFTVLGKLRTSLRENLRFWMIMVILGVVGFFFLLFTGRLTGIDLYKTVCIMDASGTCIIMWHITCNCVVHMFENDCHVAPFDHGQTYNDSDTACPRPPPVLWLQRPFPPHPFPSQAIIASNTYGLIAVMVLLGYGLVEIPRTVWRRSFPESRLQWHHYRVGRAAERLQSAGFDLQRLLQVVQATSGPISRRDPLRRNMDLIVGFVEHYSPIALCVAVCVEHYCPIALCVAVSLGLLSLVQWAALVHSCMATATGMKSTWMLRD